MKLSIIIPVYNGAKEIGRCLDSIYSQGLDENQFEVICVDDASPSDSTAEAVRSYPPRNLHLIRHLNNKRQGGARNTGIKHATGDYVTFIDHDDVYLPGVLPLIYRALEEEKDLDVLMFDMMETKLGISRHNVYSANHSRRISGIDYIKTNQMTYAAWLYAVRRSYLTDNNLWFVEQKQFEDGDWCMRLLIGAAKVKYVPIEAYHYMIHPESTTGITSGSSNIIDAFDSVVRWKDLYRECESRDEELARIIKSHWTVGAIACSYRLVHINSLRKKINLLKDYYGGLYGWKDGWYLALLSLLPTLSASIIHLMLPMLRAKLRKKHRITD